MKGGRPRLHLTQRNDGRNTAEHFRRCVLDAFLKRIQGLKFGCGGRGGLVN